MNQEEAEKLAKQIEEFANTGKEPEDLNLPDELKALLKDGVAMIAVAAKSPLFAHMLMQFGQEDGRWAIERCKEICTKINIFQQPQNGIQIGALVYKGNLSGLIESLNGEEDLEEIWLTVNALGILVAKRLSAKLKAKGYDTKQRQIMSQVLQTLSLSFCDDPKHNISLVIRQKQAGEKKNEPAA
jgi:hypothetical protein